MIWACYVRLASDRYKELTYMRDKLNNFKNFIYVLGGCIWDVCVCHSNMLQIACLSAPDDFVFVCSGLG